MNKNSMSGFFSPMGAFILCRRSFLSMWGSFSSCGGLFSPCGGGGGGWGHFRVCPPLTIYFAVAPCHLFILHRFEFLRYLARGGGGGG